MNKKIIVLAFAAAGVAAFALPAMAMAEDVPVHLVPTPTGSKTIDGEGTATLTASFGSIDCTSSSGTAEFSNGTTGLLTQTFKGCVEPFGGKCTTVRTPELPAGTIVTRSLTLHLLTVEDSVTHATGPGVLVTPTGGVFADFKCPFIGAVTVGGNGVVGTITEPGCSKSSTKVTMSFSSSSTEVQTHKTVVGTETEYSLTTNAGASSEDAAGSITLGEEAILECT